MGKKKKENKKHQKAKKLYAKSKVNYFGTSSKGY